MAKSSFGSKSIGTVIATASTVGVPVGGASAQAPGEPWNGTTVSFEGGVSFSKYWQTTFPGNATSLLPGVSGEDKTGSPATSTGSLDSPNNLAGYGSFSVAHDVNGALDWRFSAVFYDFGTTSSSASASQFFRGIRDSFTNTAAITQNDRFSFETFDFDFGHKWTLGTTQVRAFAGLRGLNANELFTTNVDTQGTDKIGSFFAPPITFSSVATNVLSNGSSAFYGAGPRVGVDFDTLSTWGLVGSVSAAMIGGVRDGSYNTTTTVTSGGAPSSTLTTSASSYRADWVGNLEGMIGVAWNFARNGQLVVGYKIDQWYNIRDNFNFAGFDNKQSIFVQTPFLKVVLRY